MKFKLSFTRVTTHIEVGVQVERDGKSREQLCSELARSRMAVESLSALASDEEAAADAIATMALYGGDEA